MAKAGRSNGGLRMANASSTQPVTFLRGGRWPLWEFTGCRVVGAPHHAKRQTLNQGGHIMRWRHGRPYKSNELLWRIDRWTRVILLVTSLAVTRLGVLLLVGR